MTQPKANARISMTAFALAFCVVLLVYSGGPNQAFAAPECNSSNPSDYRFLRSHTKDGYTFEEFVSTEDYCETYPDEVARIVVILEGRQPVDLNVERLKKLSPIPADWNAQRRQLGFVD